MKPKKLLNIELTVRKIHTDQSGKTKPAKIPKTMAINTRGKSEILGIFIISGDLGFGVWTLDGERDFKF